MANIENVKLGVCNVVYGDTDLGHTKGGVNVSYEPTYHDVAVDKYGNTIADKRLQGEKITATVPLAEATLDNIAITIPEGTKSGSKITIGSTVGDSLKDKAQQLVLHPVANAVDNLEDDVIIHKAVVVNTIEIPFQNDAERILNAEFESLLDESKDEGNYLGMIGDSTT